MAAYQRKQASGNKRFKTGTVLSDLLNAIFQYIDTQTLGACFTNTDKLMDM